MAQLNEVPKTTIQFPNEKKRYTVYGYDYIKNKELYEKIKEKLFLSLSKFSSSKKTKIVHELIEKNIPGIGILQSSIKVSPYYMSYYTSDLKLHKIVANADLIDDSYKKNTLGTLLTKYTKLQEDINREKKLITDLQAYKIEKLNKEKDKLTEEILDSIDFIKFIDVIYFGYLELLAFGAIDKNSNEKIKVFDTAEELLRSHFEKIFNKIDSKLLDDPITKSNFNLALQFFILTYFLQISKKEAINILKTHKGEWVESSLEYFIPKEEEKMKKFESPDLVKEKYEKEKKKMELSDKLKNHYDNLQKDLQKLKIDEFDDFAIILTILEVVNITKHQLNRYMEDLVGKDSYILFYRDYSRFIAFMAQLNYRTQLFEKQVEINKKAQERIEQLILNQQRKIVIKEFKYY